MALPINTIDEFREYLQGVVERATHHATNINEVILTLAGVVVLFKDPGRPLNVMTREGMQANVMWVTISGTRYALSYNYSEESVEIRRGSLQGQVEDSFDNDTTPQEILRIFRRLRGF